MPKCHNINASKSLLLAAPPKSIGFYVIPNANVPTCCCNEHTITHESTENQYENIPENQAETEAKKIDVLTKVIENELLSYDEYLKNPTEWRRLLQSQISEQNRNVNELPEDVRRVIIERAKQKKALELEEKSKHIKHLLMERARNEETKAKLLSDIEKLKANEVEQAIDELINKNSDDNKLREKRSLVTSNEDLGSWMQHEENMNAVPRPTRRIQNNLEDKTLDPVYENEQENTCACRRTGKCNCGKNYTNMFLKQMLQVLNSDQKQINTKIENYGESHHNNKLEEMKEMKNLVNELKSIVTTMKFMDIQSKSNQMNNQDQKENDSDDNEMIKVNLIPKGRMKRNTEESNNDVLEEPTNSVSKKRNLQRKKRAPLLMNDFKQLEKEIIKEITTVRSNEDTSKHIKPKEENTETVTPNEKPEDKTDNEHHSAKYKLLQRKLMHQEKLESQIEHYLQKIRQSKTDLKNELEKSFNFKHLGHIKKHVKREIWDSDSDEITDTETNKIIENNTLDSDEQAIETNLIFNEISKEGKNLPNFDKENEEATYKLKVKTYPKKRINKIIKMFENESKQNNMEIEKPKKKIVTTSSTTAPSTSKENKTEVFYDAHDENINTTTKNEESNDDGFVDEAFKTLSQCLSDFHRKIVEFLRFLSP